MTVAERGPSKTTGHSGAADTMRKEAQPFFPDTGLVDSALTDAGIGVWSWDIASNRLTWSSNMESIRGMPAGAFDGTFASFENNLHPQDRAQVRAALDEGIRSGAPFRMLYRVEPSADGQARWIETRATVVMENGKAVRLFGTARDVSERVRLHRELQLVPYINFSIRKFPSMKCRTDCSSVGRVCRMHWRGHVNSSVN